MNGLDLKNESKHKNLRLRSSVLALLILFAGTLRAEVPLGTVQQIEGKTYLCYDDNERLDLIQSLEICNGYHRAFEKCQGALSKSVSKQSVWLGFALGVIAGGVGISFIIR